MKLSFPARIRDKLIYDIAGYVPRKRPFVFGIGLSKTGTTSLNNALEILGYRAFHLPPITRVEDGVVHADWPWWVYRYNALTDLTVAALHRDLARTFVNARFIYTRRDMAGWLGSCRRHFTLELADQRVKEGQTYLHDLTRAFYGSHLYDEEKYRRAYLAHEADVMQVHEGRDNFMISDLTSGDGWAPLCDFLSKPVPDIPFPVSNKGRSRA